MDSINFDEVGKRIGHVWVKAGANASAYRHIGIPVCVIVSEPVPRRTLVLMAGVHGDEYDGQIYLNKLASSLSPEQVVGRVIIIPCANPLACEVGTRFSPIEEDNGNFYRGLLAVGATKSLAQTFASQILKHADVVIDLHSGGQSLDYNPCTVVFLSDNELINSKALAIGSHLGFPHMIVRKVNPDPLFLMSTLWEKNAVYLAAELGGARLYNAAAISELDCNLRALLKADDLPQDFVNSIKGFYTQDIIPSPHNGLFEPLKKLGDIVSKGEVVGMMQFPLTDLGLNQKVISSVSGEVIATRPNTLCRTGDCLYELAR